MAPPLCGVDARVTSTEHDVLIDIDGFGVGFDGLWISGSTDPDLSCQERGL